MEPIVLSLVTFTRWAEETTKYLCSFAQRRTILGLISLTLGGTALFAVAQDAIPPGPSASSAAAASLGNRVRNIVLVHGAWADGSGWKGVHDILVKDGRNVSRHKLKFTNGPFESQQSSGPSLLRPQFFDELVSALISE